MTVALHIGALALYVTAGGLLGASLVGGRSGLPRWGGAVLPVAVVLHGLGLGAYAVVHHELPLVGLAPSLSTLGFLIGAYLVIFAALGEVRAIGLILAPLIALLVGAALIIGVRPTGEPLTFQGWWFALHVLLGFAGCAGLAVAFASGVLYLLQFRALKGKRFGRMFRFSPPLALLDRAGRFALAVGFPAWSLALVLAWAWTLRFDGGILLGNPQVRWGLVTWVVFVLALAARSGPAGRDRRGAWASVLGFMVVVAVYVILRVGAGEGRVFL